MKSTTAIFKSIVAPLLIVSFLAVAFFSFAAMSYGSDGRMQGGCPFSATGTALCPQDALAVIMHHVSAYQSFFNTSINVGMSALIIALYAVGIASILLVNRICVPTALASVRYKPPPSVSYTEKLTRWLSLFEHSPSY
jgi:hypothetical protein